jgi:hypothetical protein
MKPEAHRLTPEMTWALIVTLLACAIIQGLATWHASEETKALVSATCDVRDSDDDLRAAVDEMNAASGKYSAATAETNRLNKLLEHTYGQRQGQR